MADKKIKVTLSGTTMINRGWDGGMQSDPNDREQQLVADTINHNSRCVSRGRGVQQVFMLNVPLATWLAEYLEGWGECYAYGGGYDDPRQMRREGRAMLRDAKRIRDALYKVRRLK